MCKHLSPPDQAEKSHFWICSVKQRVTGAAAVSFTERGEHRIFPLIKS